MRPSTTGGARWGFVPLQYFPLASPANVFSLHTTHTTPYPYTVVSTSQALYFMVHSADKHIDGVLQDGGMEVHCMELPCPLGKDTQMVSSCVVEDGERVLLVVTRAIRDVSGLSGVANAAVVCVLGLHAPDAQTPPWEYSRDDITTIPLADVPLGVIAHSADGRMHAVVCTAGEPVVLALDGAAASVTSVPMRAVFPEWEPLDAVVCLSVATVHGERWVAACTQDGGLRVTCTPTHASEPSATLEHRSDSVCSVVRLYASARDGAGDEHVHLLVGEAVGAAWLFSHIDVHGLDHAALLPRSATYDAVLCADVAPLYHTGSPQLLLGTYGHQLLVYGTPHGPSGLAAELEASGSPYLCVWSFSLAHPVVGVSVCDVNGDGVREIVVCTLFGIHVLQPELDKVWAAVAPHLEAK